jgi:predicted enzyme related to lactoylglutathione lyase
MTIPKPPIVALTLGLAAVGCGGSNPAPPQQQVAEPAADSARAMAPAASSMPATTAAPAVTQPPMPATPVVSAPAPTAGDMAPGGTGGSTAGPTAGVAGSAPAAAPPVAIRCKQRPFSKGDATLHMHHIHFNATDPEANIALMEKFFNGRADDFCSDEASSRTTHALKTERAYFLYTTTASPPPSMRNTRLAHVGFNIMDVTAELKRLLALNVPLADEEACATARQGMPCNTGTTLWFYVETPEGARFEVASGPGPSKSGFGHIHLVAPTYNFYQKVLGSALKDVGLPTVNVDGVNITNSGRSGMLLDGVSYVPTRGTVLDHIAYSTTDLDATLKRIQDAGVKLEEPISFKPEYGFRSFFVQSDEGVWVEIVEDAAYTP